MDQAPSIVSSDGGSAAQEDVSLQTGQSLLLDEPIEPKPMQLTKQTSTTQISPSGALVARDTADSVSQETIKVRKMTDGSHEIIEIATKNLPSMETATRDQPEDIVVDMKYLDAQKQESVTSELNIQHAAPQSFETVVVEPDDVTTEVVVDSDGTKRIIVRKLRKTLVTNRQTTQTHVSSMATSIGDSPPVVQAFSEATLRGQQITVTKMQPDGTIGK